MVKGSGAGEGVYVNSAFSGARTQTNTYTAYINPYMVIQNGGAYTKHIYIGSQRVVSKLGDLESFGEDPRRIEKAGEATEGVSIDFGSKYKQSIVIPFLV
ncbi:MAG: hypothetical protein OIF50_02920 [Flavobacteriaceae bacterium]|nr:hypothetical protein [Flavobacteriaceae bacterium]